MLKVELVLGKKRVSIPWVVWVGSVGYGYGRDIDNLPRKKTPQ